MICFFTLQHVKILLIMTDWVFHKILFLYHTHQLQIASMATDRSAGSFHTEDIVLKNNMYLRFIWLYASYFNKKNKQKLISSGGKLRSFFSKDVFRHTTTRKPLLAGLTLWATYNALTNGYVKSFKNVQYNQGNSGVSSGIRIHVTCRI